MKAIKVDTDTHKWLIRMAAEMQKELGRRVSIAEALRRMKGEITPKYTDISRFAGIWDISNKESEELIRHIREGRDRWRRSA